MTVAYQNITPTMKPYLTQLVDWNTLPPAQELAMDIEAIADYICQQFHREIQSETKNYRAVAMRMAKEVERICLSSTRIQNSGEIEAWQLNLAQHRLQKCLSYYRLGTKQARIELHSTLGSIVYRYVAPLRASFSFQARYQMVEDFLQSFYIESLSAFRREHKTQPDYTPRTALEVAEYLAYTEQYARRKIAIGGRGSQQLIILRAQTFARRQPAETAMDIELAADSAKTEEAEAQMRSPAMQQVRASMVSEALDPAEGVLRDRVVQELVQYLESSGQQDCIDYLSLKLQDLSAQEIDEIMGLKPRQRDYLQQRFKYHVDKFARLHQWQLVHQWLGADLDQKLGMNAQQWEAFWQQLSPQQQQLFQLKQTNQSDRAIASTLKWTPKQVQKRWTELLEQAWEIRNDSRDSQKP